MNDARAKHTATALKDGTILVVGGYRTSPHVSHDSAEIFDRSAGVFAYTGSMNDRRQCHVATLLPDGTVLVAGGNDETDQAYRSAETYDPGTGQFTLTVPMSEERTCAMATLLPDGRVLIAGGYDTAGVYSSTAEIYDPATRAFGPLLQMNYTHSCHAQALLQNGQVFLSTGCSPAEYAELFDWTTETFSVVGTMSTQRKYPFFSLLQDGRVLIAGGHDANGDDVDTAEIYTPSSSGGVGTIQPSSNSLTTGRWRGAWGLLPGGQVLMMGGTTRDASGGTQYLETAEVWDPLTGNFRGRFLMSEARAKWPRFVMSNYGYGLVTGGIDANGEATGTCDVWR